jgi:hypothetical protein
MSEQGTVAGPAQTVDDVVERLDEIIARSQQEGSRRGYFAALYRATTLRVRANIQAQAFDDAARMSRMDAIFANHYLLAEAADRAGQPVPGPWRAAFAAEEDDSLLILQHLLLGMNAHINLDLGQAAADTARVHGQELDALYKDYRHLNHILREMIDTVQDALAEVSPWLWALDWLGGEQDELAASFSITKAREQAWRAALAIERVPEARGALVQELDQKTRLIARLIVDGGSWLAPLVRWREHDRRGGREEVAQVTASLLRRFPAGRGG